jgi:tartrate-resistant acid phosphatase type 5
MLIAQWNSLLRRHKVDLYLSGHDHDLQHLQFQGHPTSFVISAEEAQSLLAGRDLPQNADRRALGRSDLLTWRFSKEQLVIRHIGRDGGVLYEFKKPPNIVRTQLMSARIGRKVASTWMGGISQSAAGMERLGFSDS